MNNNQYQPNKFKRNRLSRAIALLGVTGMLGIVPSTYAQDEGFALEEVVVTARKREENLQDTPLAITALTAEAIERRQITGTDDLDKVAPNIQFASHGPLTGNASASQVFIRGVGQTDASASVDPGVGLYIDDVYMGSSVGGSMDFRDIANIQVVRGPQGTLFGRNTIGGAVLITTTEPGDEVGGSIKLGTGSDGLLELNGAIDLPISDTFKTRFSYGSRERDGYVDHLSSGRDLGDDDTYTVTAKALWEPSDTFSLTLKADYTEEDENGVPYVFAASSPTGAFPAALSVGAGCPGATFPPPSIPQDINDVRCVNSATWAEGEFANNGSVIPESTLENSGFAAIANWDINDTFSLKYVGSVRDTDWSGIRDADNTPFVILHTRMESENEQSSHEFQLNFSGDTYQGVLGAFLFNSESDEVLHVNFTPPFAPVLPVNNGALLETESTALFGQITFDVTDSFSITGGLRYTEETKDAVIDAFGGAPVAPPGTSGLTTVPGVAIEGQRYVRDGVNYSLDFDDVSGHLNLQYKFDSMSVYASYSEAFKSGGWNPLYNAVQPLNDTTGLSVDVDGNVLQLDGGGNILPGDPTSFDPEFAETFEIGLKWDPTDSLRINAAIFQTDYKDLQLTNRVGIVPLLFNAGTASIDGVEVEFVYTPSSSLIIEGSLGVLDGEIESPVLIQTRAVNSSATDAIVDGTVQTVTATQTVQEGNSTPYSPDLTANIGFSYLMNVGDWTLTPRVDVNYVDNQYFDAGNTEEIAQTDSVTTARFALTLENGAGDLRIVAGVENLTDEVYPVAGNSSLATATGYAEIVYNRPRVYYINAEYRF
jgi:iron complex outermembrane receptor protein